MANITATIITDNNISSIGRCLESLSGIADEVIVIDAFSSDGTADLCRQHGCKVRQRRLDGYGAQKQYAVSLASNSYVLSIDADEYLDEDLRTAILRLKETGFEHRIYCLSRLNFFGNKPIRHSGWWPDKQIRLFDKRYASWDLRDVHERVIFPGTLWPAPVPGLLKHERCMSAAEHLRKETGYAEIIARMLAAQGVRPTATGARLRALVAFLRTYILKLGFLDGTEGREIAATAAAMRLVTYRTVKKIQTSEKIITDDEP